MFPDPQELIRQVHGLGFRVCLWINSYIGVESERFEEGKAKGYFLKTAAGETYVAQLWGNYHPPVAVVDFTNPEAAAWYRETLASLAAHGRGRLQDRLRRGRACRCGGPQRHDAATSCITCTRSFITTWWPT